MKGKRGIKSTIKREILVNDYDLRFEVDLSPELLEYNTYPSEQDKTFAELLSCSESFYQKIISSRLDIGFEKELKYIKAKSSEEFIDFIKRLDPDKSSKLIQNVRNQLEYFHLSDNWWLSLCSAILFHVILIPAPQPSINVHIPRGIYGIPGDIKQDILSEFNAFTRVLRFPSIYFQNYASPEEIIKWVKKNRKIIKLIQKKLPRKSIVGTNERTLYWGKIAWILWEDGVRSWEEMADKAQELVAKHKEEYPNEEYKNLEYMNEAPSGEQFANYYKRFVEYVGKTTVGV